MGQEDMSLKEYVKDVQRYADLWNGAVFHGRQLVRAEELTSADAEQVHTKEKGQAVQTTQDIVMRQMKSGRTLALWVVENQKEVDYSMPVRVMLEEALRYHEQVSSIKISNKRRWRKETKQKKTGQTKVQVKEKECPSKKVFTDLKGQKVRPSEYLYKFCRSDKLFPVVTMVVYWSDKDWDGPRTLREMLQLSGVDDLDKELLKLVPEYPLHLVNLASLEHTEYFQTELRIVMDLYRLKESKEGWRNYVMSHEECKSIDYDTYKILNVLTSTEGLEQEKIEKGGKVNMCGALLGIKEEGREQGRLSELIDLVKEGVLELDYAAKRMQMTPEEFKDKMAVMNY